MKISVAMCTYNGAQFLEEQLDSIFNQSLPINELVICDDGSTDKTLEIIKLYEQKHQDIISLHINEYTLKCVKNFEKAIKLCTGDVIFLSDQDDIWLENKVEKHIDYYHKHPEVKVIATNGYCIDEYSIVHEKHSLWDVPQFLNEADYECKYYDMVLFTGNIATGATMSFKKNFNSSLYPFPIIKGFYHDEWLMRIASVSNEFVMLEDKLTKYRTHNNQQVGGVFFDKTLDEKNMLVDMFSANIFMYKEEITTLVDYKKYIKIYINKINHELLFLEKIKPDNCYAFDFFVSKGRLIDKIIHVNNLKKRMKRQYPIQSTILFITDKVLKKRQFYKRKII